MAVQLRPVQTQTYFSTPEQLQKDSRTLTPLLLGVQPIAGYDYISHMNRTSWSSLTPIQQQVIRENIQLAKSGTFECYYFSRANPFIAQFQPDGQVIWKSVAPCNGNHVQEIVNFLTGQNLAVHVNTGNHGNHLGLIPSSGNFFEANRLGEPKFFAEDFDNIVPIPFKVSIKQLSAKTRPEYPPEANCSFDAWCFSLNTLFSDIRNYVIPKDLLGRYVPSIYKDVATNMLMEKPMYSPMCARPECRTHYYDKKTITAIKRSQPPDTLIVCRVDDCAQKIFPGCFYPDPKLEAEILEFKQKMANEEANLQKISTLQQDMLNKTQRITFLESEIGTKDQTIVGLQGRVTVEIAEKQQLKLENRKITKIVKKQRDVIDQLERGIIPEDLQEVREMANAFQNTFIQEPQMQVKIRERVALMELGDFSTPLNMPMFVKNAQKRIALTSKLLKELKNFNGLLTQGWIYQPTPFIKKGETQSEEFLESHVQAFRRYIDEVVRPSYNIIIHEASCQLVLKLDREAPLYKDILKITSESSLKLHRNLQNTELLRSELEGTLDNVHLDLHFLLKDKHLKLKTPIVSSQLVRHDPEVNWEQHERDMTEIAVIKSKTYATKLSEILSRLMAIRWCEENNVMLRQFLNSCVK